MVIKSIAWDLDGTLIHFKIDYLKARRKAINILKNHGAISKQLSTKYSILDNVQTAKKTFNSLGYNSKKIEIILNEVNEEVNKIEKDAAFKASKVEGIDLVLEFIKNRGLKQAIYTYNSHENAKISLERVKLLNYFDIIVGRDNVKNPKPHIDHLLLICKKFNVNPKEVIVIGDTSRDIEGALNLKARSIFIKTKMSFFPNSKIIKKADKIIEEKDIPLKLIQAIEKIL